MISARTLEQAVAEAVVTRAQVERLREIEATLAPAAARADEREPQDEESLRFVTGFADIFVTVGLLLFMGALAFLMDSGTGSTLMFAGLAACAWVLAEFFTFKRRMALPSIVLLVVFVGAVLMLSLQVFGSLIPAPHELPDRYWFIPTTNPGALAAAAVVTVALASLHYVRFRVPITIAAGAFALCLLAVALVAVVDPAMNETTFNLTLLLLGIAVFALAMRFDMSDPARATRRTDIAFWLHLLAAPLIVHPLIRGLLHGLDGRMTTGAALGILWVFLLLGVVAVIIDRRAILVSGLVYAGVAFGAVIRSLGFTGSSFVVPVVLLSLGAFILVLSAGWQPLRRALLRRLPTRMSRRLPHPLVQTQT